jgi:hypothetical protein
MAGSGEEHMLVTLLRLSGLARGIGSLKVRLEDKAEDALAQVKGVAMRIAIAAALALASLVFALLALIVGLVALYAYLYPIYGALPALGIVGGTLVLIAVLLAIAAALVGRSKPGKETSAGHRVEEVAAEDNFPSRFNRGNGHRVPRRYALSRREARAAADVAESVVSMTSGKADRRRARQEDYSADAITLLRTSDRGTMMAVLGAVAAAGWLAGRTVPRVMGR